MRERLSIEPQEQLVTKLDLKAALQTLTPKQRACMLLYADGHTEAEIASQIGISQPAAHQLLAKAKTHLKKILQGGY